MGPEMLLVSSLALSGATALPSRERREPLVVGSRWTCDSETTVLGSDPAGLWMPSTGDIEVRATAEDLAASAGALIKAYAEALPPVDSEAEVRIDRMMSERYVKEQRRPLLRRI